MTDPIKLLDEIEERCKNAERARHDCLNIIVCIDGTGVIRLVTALRRAMADMPHDYDGYRCKEQCICDRDATIAAWFEEE